MLPSSPVLDSYIIEELLREERRRREEARPQIQLPVPEKPAVPEDDEPVEDFEVDFQLSCSASVSRRRISHEKAPVRHDPPTHLATHAAILPAISTLLHGSTAPSLASAQ